VSKYLEVSEIVTFLMESAANGKLVTPVSDWNYLEDSQQTAHQINVVEPEEKTFLITAADVNRIKNIVLHLNETLKHDDQRNIQKMLAEVVLPKTLAVELEFDFEVIHAEICTCQTCVGRAEVKADTAIENQALTYNEW
tara:strand:+ start:6403 stop:6819 length:417 start_codon:yes stop_codon:yes gene_type:complete